MEILENGGATDVSFPVLSADADDRVVAFDADADGWQDLFVSNLVELDNGSESDKVYTELGTDFLKNNKDGSFGSFPVSMAYEEFDIPTTGFAYCYRNLNVTGRVSPGINKDLTSSSFMDLNGDGMIEMLSKSIIEVTASNPRSNCGSPLSTRKLYYTQMAGFTFEKRESGYVFQQNYNFGDASIGHDSGLHTQVNYSNYTGDLNGDGLTDVVTRIDRTAANNQDSVEWLCRVSTGTSVISNSGCGLAGEIPNDALGLTLQDINQDGRAELVFHANSGGEDKWQVTYFNRELNIFGLTQPYPIHESLGFEPNIHIGITESDNLMFLDVDGNGALDLLKLGSNEKLSIVLDAQSAINLDLDATIQPYGFEAISTITNGMGNSTSISYANMSDGSVYTPGEAVDSAEFGNGSKVFNLNSGNWLVAEVYSNAEGFESDVYQETTIGVEYHYKGLRAQAGGRGLLGFEKVSTTSVEANAESVTTETMYSQKFPYIGMPVQTQQYIGNRINNTFFANTLSLANNDYDSINLHNGSVVFPFLETSTERAYTVNNEGTDTYLLSTKVTSQEFETFNENHANLKNVTIILSHHLLDSTPEIITLTTNRYEQDNVDKWWLGRITASTVSHNRVHSFPEGNVATSISSSFDYYTDGVFAGMLKTETVLPSSVDIREQLITLHCYDQVGNKEKIISYSSDISGVDCKDDGLDHNYHVASPVVSNQNSVYRYSETNFDNERRYVSSKSNGVFESSSVIARNKFGQTTESKNIDSVTTKANFDLFGRPISVVNSVSGAKFTDRRLYNNLWEDTPNILDQAALYYVERLTAEAGPTQYKYFDRLGRNIATVTQSFESNEWVHKYVRFNSNSLPILNSQPILVAGKVSASSPIWSTTFYDSFKRVNYIVSADNTLTDITYSGLTTTTTSSTSDGYNLSMSKSETNDITGKLLSVTDDAGKIRYYYDNLGNLTKVVGPEETEAATITTTFDMLGRKIAMNDPNKGAWTYSYNALGQLTEQVDSEGNITQNFYDKLGRITWSSLGTSSSNLDVTRYEYSGHRMVAECFYDSTGCSKTAPIKHYYFDAVGRNSLTTIEIEGQKFASLTTFDEFGRVFQQFDPDSKSPLGCIFAGSVDISSDCRGVKFSYTDTGAISRQEEARFSASADRAQVYYDIIRVDEFGNVVESVQNATDEQSKLTTEKIYSKLNGHLVFQKTKNAQNQVLMSHIYTFDSFGNLRKRENISSGFTEEFGYDHVFRLEEVSGSPIKNVSLTYDVNGNIKTKSDLEAGADYGYGEKSQYCSSNDSTPGAHAVTNVGAKSFCYDNKGNQTKTFSNGVLSRSITYGAFGKATEIHSVSENKRTSFFYDNKRNRFKRTDNGSEDGSSTTLYIGNTELINKSDGSNEVRRYIPGGIQTTIDGFTSTRYFLKDHLGSIDTIANDKGKIIEKLYFDAWGKKHRLTVTDSWSLQAQSAKALTLVNVLKMTYRGFTDHEHVEHADIINMNGRIYDPTLGRFLQADPYIQAPMNSQNYNRYSYVLNNPLSYTDPSGYFFKSLFKKINKALGDFAPFVSIALSIWAPWGNGFWASIGTGFVSGGIATGSFKGALIGAFTAGAFHGVGTHFEGLGKLSPGLRAAKVFAHGVVGGVSSVLSGGKFGHGFASAGVTQALSGSIDSIDRGIKFSVKRVVAAAIVGGTSSSITGGKFANGAVTGAFSRVFNDEFHFENISDKNLLELSEGKGEFSLEVVGHKLFGLDIEGNVNGPELGLDKLSISQTGVDVELMKSGPFAVKTDGKSLTIGGKACTHGSSGLCGSLSTKIDSPAIRAAVGNVIKATTPIPVTNYRTGETSFRIWILEILGIPQPVGVK
jgi:RHS repeat-associated protein